MILLGVLIMLMSIAVPAAVAQQQPLTISGRVVAAEDERPLRRARITTSDAGERHSVLTDDDGRFDAVVRDLSQPLVVIKAGYAAVLIDLRREGARPNRPIEVRLSRGAAISGRVIDDMGAPVVGVRVNASRLDGTDAEWKWTQESETDDRGEYRIGGLSAGKYGVSLGAARFVMPNNRGGNASTAIDSSVPAEIRAAMVPPAGMPVTISPRQNLDTPARVVDLQPGDDTTAVDLTASAWPSDESVRAMKTLLERERGRAPRGRITGRVTTTDGEAIGGAEVRATRSNLLATRPPSAATRMSAVTTADRTGRFSVELLDDGEYLLEASKVAHVIADDRAASDPMLLVHVVNGAAEPVQLTLSRGGAISGTIVDSAGEPLQGVRVNALRVLGENGQVVAVPAGWDRTTDDRGRYRVFGLPTGSYLVTATINAESTGTDRVQQRGLPRAYFPGTASIDGAQPLRVQAGAELTGLDVSIAPVFTAHISGRAFDSAGEPLAGRVQLAISRRASAMTTEPLVARVNPDGTFELTGVPSGDYVLQAVGEPRFGRAAEFGVESVTVGNRNPDPVTVHTSTGSTLEGRFIVEGVADPPLRALAIHASTLDLDRGPRGGRGPEGLAVHDDGRFSLTGLRGPMRFIATSLPTGWYLKSVTIGGADVSDVPFDFGSTAQTIAGAEILLSPAGAMIAGAVTDRPGTPASNFVAVAFSTSRELWFTGSRHVQRRSGANGLFAIDGLPPGDYWVVAVDRLDADDWTAREVLDTLVPGASRVTVLEGQVLSTDLRLFRRSR